MFQSFLKHHLQLVKCHYKNASTCNRGSTCLGTWGITATIRMNQFAARGAKLNRALVTVSGILTILNTTNVNDILKLLFTLLKFHFKMPLAVTVVNTSLPIVQSCFCDSFQGAKASILIVIVAGIFSGKNLPMSMTS